MLWDVGATPNLVEQSCMGEFQKICQEVETTAVWHSKYDVLHSSSSGGSKEDIKCRKHRFPSLKAIPLQIGELQLEKLVERLALREQRVYARLLILAHLDIARRLRLEEVGEPQPLRLRRRVHVLIGDAANVD